MASQPAADRNTPGTSRYLYQKQRAAERRLQFDQNTMKVPEIERRLPACSRCSVKHEDHAIHGCSRYTETRLTC